MKYTVLLVDDEPMLLRALKRQLADMNLNVIAISDPNEAKEVLKINTVDILITDQKMPGRTGLELVKYFQKVSPGTMLILMSAYTDYEVMCSAINEGHVYFFLQKPWVQEELHRMLNKVIEVKQQAEYNEHVVKSYLLGKDKWMAATAEYEMKAAKHEESTISAFRKIVEVKDKELYLHSQRVAEIAFGFAKHLKLQERECEEIRLGAEFHDMGKIVIKDRILYKEASLDADEFEEMKRHPQIGAEILMEVETLSGVALIVEQHHERSDGKGYPKGLADEEICIGAKIISMADAYDALKSERVYKKGKSKEETLKIMRQGGAGKYNQELMAEFGCFIDGPE